MAGEIEYTLPPGFGYFKPGGTNPKVFKHITDKKLPNYITVRGITEVEVKKR
eukprot:CAMPEP_0117025726 /NCGR_PEP_ID=MMETSP0472-20121206/18980_1 /TAXON_ID=693140 ORGANISM="Tiarina fusus, Strain LIS" /NCGR_SAMPLE_ID=MMETSP0472 /ASSEMBLY_ACC=CAM_ASM_000603 /LENGTH=51 /DNA_ID=CAMNT_0004732531 /DNA_START=1301 /DNA_END=1456 /DNA_ORIENTATION=-